MKILSNFSETKNSIYSFFGHWLVLVIFIVIAILYYFLGNELLKVFIHPTTVLVIIIVFIVVSRLSSLSYLRKLNPILQNLEEVKNKLYEIKDRKEYFERYEEIRLFFESKNYVKNCWGEYDETIIADDESREIISPKRAHDYFNEQLIVSPTVNLRLFFAIPNLLIGVGLLLTFFGIVIALNIASSGITGGTAASSDKALQDLLAAASTKFSSSIVALICSLTFSGWQKHYYDKIITTIDDICHRFEELTIHKSVEQLVYEDIKIQNTILTCVDSLAINIGLKIGEVLENQLPKSIALTMQPLAEALMKIATKMEQTGESGMQDMIEKFMNRLHSSTNNEMSSLAETLKQLQGGLSNVLESISSTGSNFGNTMFNAAGEINNSLKPVSENLTSFGEVMKSIPENISLLLKEFESNIKGLNQTVENFNTIAKSIDIAGQPILSANRSISDASNSLTDVSNNIKSFIESSKTTLQSVENISSGLEKAWISYQEKFEKVDADLEKGFRVMQDGLKNFTGEAEKFIQNMDSKFAKSLTSFSGALEDLSDNIESLNSKK